MVENLHASLRSRFFLLLVTVPITLLFIGAGAALAAQRNYLAGAAFFAIGLFIAVFLVFQLTLRVDIDEASVTRSWLFGRRVVPMQAITRLTWGGARGTLILTISYGKRRFIQLSSNALSEPALRQIQKDILAARGLEAEPLLPLFAEQVGYVDIAEMSRRKHA